MRYQQQIESALAHAAPLEVVNGQMVTNESPSIADFSGSIPRRHEDIIKWPSQEEHVPLPYAVYTEEADDLRQVLLEYHLICGIPLGIMAINLIDQEVCHERQHSEAAIALGATFGIWSLNIYYRSASGFAWQLGYVPAGLKTTRIGAAMIVAAPDILHTSDQTMLQALGYKSTAEVKQIAHQYGLA